MKPFLILQHRPIDEAADNELEAFLKYGGLKFREVLRIRMEENGIPDLDLEDYSGIICGGGPSNVSDPEEKKSESQLKFESDFNVLYPTIIAKDFPFLGACYGIGALSKFLGAEVSTQQFAEAVGSSMIKFTKEALSDPLTSGLSTEFKAFVGHKEACQELAPRAILLASSSQCPIQMIRIGQNVYATQFHPELDTDGLALRIRIYRNHGYFDPDEAESLIARIRDDVVTTPSKILKRFVERYRK